MYGHYAAPAAALACALTITSLRRLRRYGGAVGRLLVRTAVAVFVLWSLMWWIGFFGWQQNSNSWQVRRSQIEHQVAQNPGKHLIIVRYRDHNVHEEWVYNGADLTEAKVIWARELDEATNRHLLDHYSDRKIWLVRPDDPDTSAVRLADRPELHIESVAYPTMHDTPP